MDLCNSENYTIEGLMKCLPIIALVLSEVLPYYNIEANGIIHLLTKLTTTTKKAN